ncbi:hypothetical protein I5J47_gp41 [Mycobacterium phage Arib1]|uniref:Uncharacterized protein n=4 Tax=Fishburnevirus TaxID=1983734 RepID=A0A514A5R3_9CAUD|nr:hypothetical protein MALITHI_41 [Mycobacterium phage Malithi]YP_009964925.1 hypothetical protein I5J47_gp41 [Mycobacterium phage Arib1]YP_009965003.1 hypothetical protein I5J48_gp41 [Mycobacterium phage Majeke]AYQ99874.1 hypothetical protein PBI_MANGETHE_41 [Mycobacterium phage Mangethe]QDH48609.1 hypothetical protein SEA_TECHAGE_41 [Mycobacterium phage Techage]AJF40397.1 hypothetical protein MALITHI_41 [Mycobacterium phage Malithi]ASZ75301.1 hypothetical protein PBI_MAJEKE_41 [Mycobacteri
MMRRSKGRHWPAEGRPSVYAIRHRLHNELRPTGRFLCGAEIHERKGVEYLVFKNLTIATNGPDNGDTTIGELVVELPADTGELPAIGGAQ